MLSKNQCVELDITGLTHEGDGVGRSSDGMAVFVPLTAPGDRAIIKIVKVQKNHAWGILQELVVPAEHRVRNDCPVFAQCGGCSLRHIAYEEELRIKAGWVRENLRRIGGVEIEPEETIAAPEPARYRNKAQYPVRLVGGRVRAGFFAKRSHRMLPVGDCLLQPAFFGEVCAAVTAFMERHGIAPYDEEAHTGLVRHIFVRYAGGTGETMVCLMLNGEELPHAKELVDALREVCPGLASFCVNSNTRRTNVILGERTKVLFGGATIADVLCGVRLQLSPHSFYQVNRAAAELLYAAARRYADPRPGDLLLDLYCGAGAIGLSMAGAAREVVGVEAVPQAVENARRNAAQNGIRNARFLCADAAEAAQTLLAEGLRPDIVLLDPPRKGVDRAVIRCIGELLPRKVVYISCNSATLSRDCKLFAELGYAVKRARAVDLFPRTAHVEAVALLSRVRDSEKINITMEVGLNGTTQKSVINK